MIDVEAIANVSTVNNHIIYRNITRYSNYINLLSICLSNAEGVDGTGRAHGARRIIKSKGIV